MQNRTRLWNWGRSLSAGLLMGSLLALGACQKEDVPVVDGTPIPEDPAPLSPDESPSPTEPEVPATSTEITGTSLGPAQLGMTFGDLKQAMPDATFEVQSPFMVDFDAIAVSQNGEIQFYILYLASDSFDDSDIIQGLLTENPDYRTAEGIGPESLIVDGVTAYGSATLSYNTENESREYVRFEQHPTPNLAFRTGSGPEAGIYPEINASFYETTDYRPDAVIQSVMLVCFADGCAPPEE